MRQKRVTIKDVAELAQVSIATVSRVVNGNYYVGPEITARVNDAIKKLDYRPNFFARSLKGASSLTMAIVVSNISNTYYNYVARAVEQVVWPHDYGLIFSSTEGQAERELATLKTLINKHIDGLILNTTGHNDEFISMASQSLPVVLLHRRLKTDGFRGDLVDSDNRVGAAMLTRHLREHGHVQIGAINGLLDLSAGEERYAGLRDVMKEAGVSERALRANVFNGDFTAKSGYLGMEYFHRKRPDVTGVVIMNNAMTIGALRYLREHQIRVPEDISLVCFGDLMNRDLLWVRPTTVSLDPETIGLRAGELLISRIADRATPRREFIYEPQLNAGESVARVAGTAAVEEVTAGHESPKMS